MVEDQCAHGVDRWFDRYGVGDVPFEPDVARMADACLFDGGALLGYLGIVADHSRTPHDRAGACRICQRIFLGGLQQFCIYVLI